MKLLSPAPQARQHVAFSHITKPGLQQPCQPTRILLVRSELPGSEGTATETIAQEAPKNICKTCGVDLGGMPWGCKGEGRIMGGIASVPGFGWWPIKAYRECPEAIKRGIQYRRAGQITDEMLFRKK